MARGGGRAVGGAAFALPALQTPPRSERIAPAQVAHQLEVAGAGAGRDVGRGRVALLGPGLAVPRAGADPDRLYLLPGIGAVAGNAVARVPGLHLHRAAACSRTHRHRHQPALALATGDHPVALVLHHRADGSHLRQCVRPGDHAQGPHRRAGRPLAHRDGGDGRRAPHRRRRAPRGRGRQPRQDPVLRRRQPRFAPAAARDGLVRRSTAQPQPRRRGGLARQQHQRKRRCAGRSLRRAARHHAHRHRLWM
jgi:hypothetical protein